MPTGYTFFVIFAPFKLPVMDLQKHMNGAIRRIMAKAYLNVLSNPREARTVHRLQDTFLKSERRRQAVSEEMGLDVPPFLICSISTECNLSCKGCYARANGIADDPGKSLRETLTPQQWRHIFEEAAGLGVNFALLAGGEPMMRKDILEEVSKVEDIIFPVFTNGTLIGPSYIDFLKERLNVIPVISIEGTEHVTDSRRGKGVYGRAMLSAENLHKENLFYGVSITVTTRNLTLVTSDEYVDRLRERGCKMIIYVEYVPTSPGTEYLALGDKEVEMMEAVQDHQRDRYPDIIIISFPGDEKNMGGCLAAGRGFFHIGPDGSAEPCPFSPYSDCNVITSGLKGALQSRLFRQLRDMNLVGGEHTGGCTLWEHRQEVERVVYE